MFGTWVMLNNKIKLGKQFNQTRHLTLRFLKRLQPLQSIVICPYNKRFTIEIMTEVLNKRNNGKEFFPGCRVRRSGFVRDRLAYPMTLSSFPLICERMPPIPLSLASVSRINSLLKSGYTKIG